MNEERPVQLQDLSGNPDPNHEIGSGSDPEDYPHGIKLILITTALILSIFLSALDSTIISTLIPTITDVFNSLSQVGWYGSTYALTNASFISVWGKAYTYFKLKPTFLSAIFIFEVGNLMCGAAPNSPTLIVGRAIAGAGGAGIMSGVFIIIAFIAKPTQRPLYMSMLGVTFAVASVTGPLLGGLFVDHIGWRWGFWVNLPIGVVAASMIFAVFTTPRAAVPRTATISEKIRHMDLLGAAFMMGAFICFINVMHVASSVDGWKTPSAIGSLVGFGCLAILFGIVEWRMADRAMIQGHLLRKVPFVANLVFIFFLAGLYFPLLYSLPIQFQSINNDSASQSGIRLIPLIFGISVFTMVSNSIMSRFRHLVPLQALLVMGSVFGTIGGSLIYTLNAKASTSYWVLCEIITAIGIGLAFQVPMVANQSSVPASDIPSATSITLFFEVIGQSIFVAAGEAAFLSKLVTSSAASHIDSERLLAAGATKFRHMFDDAEVQSILSSYLDALRVNHALSMSCGAVMTVISLFMAAPIIKNTVRARLRHQHEP